MDIIDEWLIIQEVILLTKAWQSLMKPVTLMMILMKHLKDSFCCETLEVNIEGLNLNKKANEDNTEHLNILNVLLEQGYRCLYI